MFPPIGTIPLESAAQRRHGHKTLRHRRRSTLGSQETTVFTPQVMDENVIKNRTRILVTLMVIITKKPKQNAHTDTLIESAPTTLPSA